jgi:hypothetical protein
MRISDFAGGGLKFEQLNFLTLLTIDESLPKAPHEKAYFRLLVTLAHHDP